MMKRISLILSMVLVIIIAGCGAKEEKRKEREKKPVVKVEDTKKKEDIVKKNIPKPDDKTLKDSAFASDTKLKKDTVVEKPVDVKKTDKKDKEPVRVENEDGTTKKISDDDLKKEKKKAKKNKKDYVKKFYIIAGSFKKISNAVNLRKFFKDNGYSNAMVLYPYNEFNRVATNSYKTLEAARKDIEVIKNKNIKFKKDEITYWLLWR